MQYQYNINGEGNGNITGETFAAVKENSAVVSHLFVPSDA